MGEWEGEKVVKGQENELRGEGKWGGEDREKWTGEG